VKALGAVVDARNGFYGASNEFAFLRGVDLVTLSNLDHWAFSYAQGTGDTLSDKASALLMGVVFDPAYNVCKAISQGVFHYEFLPTGKGPQAPANFDFWALAGAMAAIQNRPPAPPAAATGFVPYNPPPIKPSSSSDNSSVFVIKPSAGVPVPLDPPSADGYTYFVISGPLLSSVMVPQSSVPGIREVSLTYSNRKISLTPDRTYTFETPVNLFILEGLRTADPRFIVNVSFTDSELSILGQVMYPPSARGLPGDLNGNRRVDCADLNLVRAFLGKSRTEPGFDPRADVNGDGVINQSDVSLVQANIRPRGMNCAVSAH
jgi:Dockerin type I domain